MKTDLARLLPPMFFLPSNAFGHDFGPLGILLMPFIGSPALILLSLVPTLIIVFFLRKKKIRRILLLGAISFVGFSYVIFYSYISAVSHKRHKIEQETESNELIIRNRFDGPYLIDQEISTSRLLGIVPAPLLDVFIGLEIGIQWYKVIHGVSNGKAQIVLTNENYKVLDEVEVQSLPNYMLRRNPRCKLNEKPKQDIAVLWDGNTRSPVSAWQVDVKSEKLEPIKTDQVVCEQSIGDVPFKFLDMQYGPFNDLRLELMRPLLSPTLPNPTVYFVGGLPETERDYGKIAIYSAQYEWGSMMSCLVREGYDKHKFRNDYRENSVPLESKILERDNLLVAITYYTGRPSAESARKVIDHLKSVSFSEF